MKIVTFILKLLFLVYSFQWLGRSFKASREYTRRGGNDPATDMPGGGSLLMAGICALPTVLIVGYILQALEKVQ